MVIQESFIDDEKSGGDGYDDYDNSEQGNTQNALT